MDKSKWLSRAPVVSVSVFITIVISHLIIVSIVGVAAPGADDQAPTAVERGINFNSPFQKLRSLIKLAWAHFKIPDSERIKGGESNAGVKSNRKSESEASESMGKAAGDVVHQAAEKIKTTISHNDEQDQKEL